MLGRVVGTAWKVAIAPAAAFAAALLVLGPVASLAGAPPPDTFLSFDEATLAPLLPGCGGDASNWEPLRDIDDPRNGRLRSRGAVHVTCALVKGTPFEDGVVSARIRIARGEAGLALRASGDAFVAVTLDKDASRVVVARGTETASKEIASATIDPIANQEVELTVVSIGSRLTIFVDGRKVLEVPDIPEGVGEAGPLAAAKSSAEFDDVEIWSPHGSIFPLVPTAVVSGLRAGAMADRTLPCLGGDGTPQTCRLTLEGGRLPRGLRLDPTGALRGIAGAEGESTVIVGALDGAGGRAGRPLRIRISGARWPRFPFDLSTHATRSLAVLYTPDDIGQKFSLLQIGKPDDWLFRLHVNHPEIRVALMSCPRNRYLGERPVGDFPDVVALWKMIAMGDPYPWLELGGHGYTHSPDGDTNLDHHEFSTRNTGCNIDHARMADPVYCRDHLSRARETYRAAGIPDDRVIVMRFPGVADNPEALRAALDAGFIAIFGRRHFDEAGREWWVPAARGGEMLEIEDSHLQTVFARSERLEKDLEDGKVAPAGVASTEAFKAAVTKGAAYVDRIAAGGGILNFANHYWETFDTIGGAQPRYLILDAVLHDIEERFGERAWFPQSRELAFWLDARRHARVEWREEKGGARLTIDPPRAWARMGLTGLTGASILVSLPAGFRDPGSVEIHEERGGWRPLGSDRYWKEGDEMAVTFPLRGRVEIRVRPAAP